MFNMLEKNKPENHATDKHGLLSAPIPETLRKMTVPMTMGMIAILMFNLVDTFFYLVVGDACPRGNQLHVSCHLCG